MKIDVANIQTTAVHLEQHMNANIWYFSLQELQMDLQRFPPGSNFQVKVSDLVFLIVINHRSLG